jgi:hypothetical protein
VCAQIVHLLTLSLVHTPVAPTAVHTRYLWLGKGCSGDERDFMHKIRKAPGMNFQSKNTDPELVTEGSEPAVFWKALGTTSEDGPTAYAKTEVEDVPERDPRLFQCSDARGYVSTLRFLLLVSCAAPCLLLSARDKWWIYTSAR